MSNNNGWTKAMALFGTTWVWLPMVAPLLFGIVRLLTRGQFLFDYLMPAELAMVILIGSAMLLWAAHRVQHPKRIILGGLIAAAVTLVVMQGLAEATGLASGATEPSGWQMGSVMAILVAYWISVVVIGVGGIRLVRALFQKF